MSKSYPIVLLGDPGDDAPTIPAWKVQLAQEILDDRAASCSDCVDCSNCGLNDDARAVALSLFGVGYEPQVTKARGNAWCTMRFNEKGAGWADPDGNPMCDWAPGAGWREPNGNITPDVGHKIGEHEDRGAIYWDFENIANLVYWNKDQRHRGGFFGNVARGIGGVARRLAGSKAGKVVNAVTLGAVDINAKILSGDVAGAAKQLAQTAAKAAPIAAAVASGNPALAAGTLKQIQGDARTAVGDFDAFGTVKDDWNQLSQWFKTEIQPTRPAGASLPAAGMGTDLTSLTLLWDAISGKLRGKTEIPRNPIADRLAEQTPVVQEASVSWLAVGLVGALLAAVVMSGKGQER